MAFDTYLTVSGLNTAEVKDELKRESVVTLLYWIRMTAHLCYT